MKNKRIINKRNLIANLDRFRSKKICAMVKANAYGHGVGDIVGIIEPCVDCFGVVNIKEALAVRELSSKPIYIFAKTEDFSTSYENNFCVLVDDELGLKKAIENNCKLFLKLNCGMNRYGVKEVSRIKKIDGILCATNTKVEAICTHFSDTDTPNRTIEEYSRFVKLCENISQRSTVCLGGSNISNYDFEYDMIRVGIAMYGYGHGMMPVQRLVSYVSKVYNVEKGETVGYSDGFLARKRGRFAVVPVGYGDGLRRCLSNNFGVKIRGKMYRSVGNICMDAFFVEVDDAVKVGDEVVVMENAKDFSKGTIVYEVLTGFSNFRGETVID